jgi:hypothetical protein
MTLHDPFSYGQVSLGAGKKPATESPDELLFADAGPAKKAPPATDSSWELPDADAPSILPPPPGVAVHSQTTADFAAEILGVGSSAAAAKPESAPSRSAMGRPQPQAAVPAPRLPAAPPAAATARTAAPVAAGSGASTATPRPAGRAVRLPHAMPPRASHLTSAVVPAVLFLAGGTTAAWLYMQHNLVMAGIVGALSLVGTVYARVWLRS